MTADAFRRLALDMPGAVEQAHMGHPDFRANGRIFATLRPEQDRGMVKLEPDEQQVFIGEHSEVFTPSSGAWGRQGCTDVRLTAATAAVVRPALLLAWEHVAAKPRPRARR